MLERRESVDGFLDDLRRDLRRLDEPYLQQILSETEGHLRQSVEELVDLGVTPWEAEAAAVAAFGRPKFEPSASRVSRFAEPVMAGSALVSTVFALSSLSDFAGNSRAAAETVALVIGGPLLAFAGLGFLGAEPRFRLAPRLMALGAAALLAFLPARFVVNSPGWHFQRLAPAVSDPFFAKAELKRLRTDIADGSSPVIFVDGGDPLARRPFEQQRADLIVDSLRESYGSKLVQMSPWAVILPGLWLVASMLFQAAGYGFYLARRVFNRRVRA